MRTANEPSARDPKREKKTAPKGPPPELSLILYLVRGLSCADRSAIAVFSSGLRNYLRVIRNSIIILSPPFSSIRK